jgi:hypothetical protein
MVRPSAKTIIKTEVTDYLGVDILEAQGLYAVLYKEQPINIRQRSWTAAGEMTKYPKIVYPSLAAANNLAKKLNLQFNCADFTAKKII